MATVSLRVITHLCLLSFQLILSWVLGESLLCCK